MSEAIKRYRKKFCIYMADHMTGLLHSKANRKESLQLKNAGSEYLSMLRYFKKTNPEPEGLDNDEFVLKNFMVFCNTWQDLTEKLLKKKIDFENIKSFDTLQ